MFFHFGTDHEKDERKMCFEKYKKEWKKILKERGITILNFIGIIISTTAESAES